MTKVMYIFWETEWKNDVATLQTTNIYNPGTRKMIIFKNALGWVFCDHSFRSFVDTYFSTPWHWVSGFAVWSFLLATSFNHQSPALNKLVAHFGGNKSPETLEHFKHVTWNHAYPISSDAFKNTRFLRPLITYCINKRRTTSISIYIQSPKKAKNS